MHLQAQNRTASADVLVAAQCINGSTLTEHAGALSEGVEGKDGHKASNSAERAGEVDGRELAAIESRGRNGQ